MKDNKNNFKEIHLKPCPFCGKRGELNVKYELPLLGEEIIHCAFVQCEFCRASTQPFGTIEGAVRAWNNRVENKEENIDV